nr:uncharacterized protein LOC107426769 isoform X2 [Ziziphus jujuba var. spinosa]XP_024933094.2 uncharacterized protein LOC107426769 isoform X2 [Ziziphus jujuba var. spinosa]XP_048337106.1 uncharacterized protein LOC107426769 isoform X2 [Ziziphus jujuba var. spinosa]XP_048337107.1 uncharacterized protein LOC107426769 isoform X2 [Ziziphus jujuba var. spinosa]XP_048337108.1 uncharacterized protein LOC107426769 isoform X2 [Ziziphus jujuba var. spinosa]XP_048337109.1 uncharacterized protein LOC107
MDPFEDLFSEPSATVARVGQKFKPKAKPRPRKETSASVPLVVTSDTKGKVEILCATSSETTKSTLPVGVVDDGLEIPHGSCLAITAANGTTEALENCEDFLSSGLKDITETKNDSTDVVAPNWHLGFVDGSHQEVAASNIGVNEHSGFRKPESEADLLHLNVDPFTDNNVEPDASNRSEQETFPSIPSTLPDTIEEEPVGLDSLEFSQHGDVGKSAKKVDSVQFDSDPFGDILFEPATSNTCTSHKFRPKPKPQPRKGSPTAVASTLPSVMGSPNLDTVQSVQSVDVGKGRLADQGESSLATSEILGRKEPLKSIEDPCSSVLLSDTSRSLLLGDSSQSLPVDALQPEVPVLDGSGDWHSSFGKPVGENADFFSGLECLDDFLTQPTSGMARDAIKSHCKVDMDIQHKNKFSTSFCVNNDGKDSISHSEVETLSEENSCAPANGSIVVCDAAQSQTCSDYHTTQDPVSCNGALVSDKYDEAQIGNGRSMTKVTGSLFDFETLDAISEDTGASGKRAAKFQPKPKLKKGKEKPLGVESARHVQAEHLVSFETRCMREGSIPQFLHEEVLDDTSARFGDSVALGSTSEIQGNSEPKNVAEITRSGDDILGDVMNSEDAPDMPEEVINKSGTQKAFTESIPLRKHKTSSTNSEGIEGEKSSRELRKRSAQQLVDEPVDEACEPPSISNTDVDEDDDDEYRENRPSQKKKTPRKPKKPLPESDKPVRKRTKANEAPDQSTKVPPKKFSHSTRRNRRHVNKDLLDMPEDEIDPQKLSIKDLILLAEHRERLAIKEASKSNTTQANQSSENFLNKEASHNEEDSFASEHDRDSEDGQESCGIKPSSSYINYQSFMNRTPTTRWSKQDTELFYQAVRQFGTDFSMIQQLFPDRTRHQIKLKFKKEERQYPLRLSEAVTNRAKDHSHFESVIERLQQDASHAKQEYDRDDSIGVAGKEAEVAEGPIHDASAGATKSELGDNVVKVQEADVEVHSPAKSDKSDDSDRWFDYDY